MKRRNWFVSFLLVVCIAVCASLIPPGENYCLDGDDGPSESGYCNSFPIAPGVVGLVIYWCEPEIGFKGQSPSCIGNSLNPSV